MHHDNASSQIAHQTKQFYVIWDTIIRSSSVQSGIRALFAHFTFSGIFLNVFDTSFRPACYKMQRHLNQRVWQKQTPSCEASCFIYIDLALILCCLLFTTIAYAPKHFVLELYVIKNYGKSLFIAPSFFGYMSLLVIEALFLKNRAEMLLSNWLYSKVGTTVSNVRYLLVIILGHPRFFTIFITGTNLLQRVCIKFCVNGAETMRILEKAFSNDTLA